MGKVGRPLSDVRAFRIEMDLKDSVLAEPIDLAGKDLSLGGSYLDFGFSGDSYDKISEAFGFLEEMSPNDNIADYFQPEDKPNVTDSPISLSLANLMGLPTSGTLQFALETAFRTLASPFDSLLAGLSGVVPQGNGERVALFASDDEGSFATNSGARAYAVKGEGARVLTEMEKTLGRRLLATFLKAAKKDATLFMNRPDAEGFIDGFIAVLTPEEVSVLNSKEDEESLRAAFLELLPVAPQNEREFRRLVSAVGYVGDVIGNIDSNSDGKIRDISEERFRRLRSFLFGIFWDNYDSSKPNGNLPSIVSVLETLNSAGLYPQNLYRPSEFHVKQAAALFFDWLKGSGLRPIGEQEETRILEGIRNALELFVMEGDFGAKEITITDLLSRFGISQSIGFDPAKANAAYETFIIVARDFEILRLYLTDVFALAPPAELKAVRTALLFAAPNFIKGLSLYDGRVGEESIADALELYLLGSIPHLAERMQWLDPRRVPAEDRLLTMFGVVRTDPLGGEILAGTVSRLPTRLISKIAEIYESNSAVAMGLQIELFNAVRGTVDQRVSLAAAIEDGINRGETVRILNERFDQNILPGLRSSFQQVYGETLSSLVEIEWFQRFLNIGAGSLEGLEMLDPLTRLEALIWLGVVLPRDDMKKFGDGKTTKGNPPPSTPLDGGLTGFGGGGFGGFGGGGGGPIEAKAVRYAYADQNGGVYYVDVPPSRKDHTFSAGSSSRSPGSNFDPNSIAAEIVALLSGIGRQRALEEAQNIAEKIDRIVSRFERSIPPRKGWEAYRSAAEAITSVFLAIKRLPPEVQRPLLAAILEKSFSKERHPMVAFEMTLNDAYMQSSRPDKETHIWRLLPEINGGIRSLSDADINREPRRAPAKKGTPSIGPSGRPVRGRRGNNPPRKPRKRESFVSSDLGRLYRMCMDLFLTDAATAIWSANDAMKKSPLPIDDSFYRKIAAVLTAPFSGIRSSSKSEELARLFTTVLDGSYEIDFKMFVLNLAAAAYLEAPEEMKYLAVIAYGVSNKNLEISAHAIMQLYRIEQNISEVQIVSILAGADTSALVAGRGAKSRRTIFRTAAEEALLDDPPHSEENVNLLDVLPSYSFSTPVKDLIIPHARFTAAVEAEHEAAKVGDFGDRYFYDNIMDRFISPNTPTMQPSIVIFELNDGRRYMIEGFGYYWELKRLVEEGVISEDLMKSVPATVFYQEKGKSSKLAEFLLTGGLFITWESFE